MENSKLVEGIKILSKYVEDDGFDFQIWNNQIYFAQYDIVSVEDKERLLELGWFEDEDSWSAFI